MTDVSEYVLVVETEQDEVLPLDTTVTLGRHLDNDYVLAGEDVADFHVRFELGERGVGASPIGEAPVAVNLAHIDDRYGLTPGDVVLVGSHRLRFELAHPPGTAPVKWALYSLDGHEQHAVDGSLSVGRGESSELRIVDGHVSRAHAELATRQNSVWLRDLGSSNGTFVNGEAVVGGIRLFHGDEVAFDVKRYQLVGEAPDMTPIRFGPDDGAEDITADVPAPVAETTELETVDLPAAEVPDRPDTDAFQTPCLIGVTAPVGRRTFELTPGIRIVGRGAECDLYLDEPSVSARHAEIRVRSEGVSVISLMSTNGTFVNGNEVHSARLEDGDLLAFGRVQFVFRAGQAAFVPASRAARRRYALWGGALLVLAAVIGLVLAL